MIDLSKAKMKNISCKVQKDFLRVIFVNISVLHALLTFFSSDPQVQFLLPFAAMHSDQVQKLSAHPIYQTKIFPETAQNVPKRNFLKPVEIVEY
mgnify:CR=1 FL=1